MKKLPITNYQLPITRSGQAVITAVVFSLLVLMLIVAGAVSASMKEIGIARNLIYSKKSYFLAEAGTEDVVYRIMNGKNYNATEILSLDGEYATTTVTNISGIEKEIVSVAKASNLGRKIKTRLTNGDSYSFHYGVQAGDGGFFLEQSSEITGNAYSNGPITGGSKNYIRGDAISAGPSGLINNIHTTGSSTAHTINNTTTDGHAYYTVLSGGSTAGFYHGGALDAFPATMPISDNQIDDWENAAALGGTIGPGAPCSSGTYEIDSDITIGNKKIACNLEIKGTNFTVTVTGPIWVTGNITFSNSPLVKLDASLGNASVPIIAHNPTATSTSGKIIFGQGATVQGSGDPSSYILFVSRNNSKETGGSTVAISSQQSSSGKALLYAPHGEIFIEQTANLKEVTGYYIHARNSAQVVYETGLASLLFSGGPSGGYEISLWQETQ